MNNDEAFDTWLNQANGELIDSMYESLDVDETLTLVKYAAELPDRARETASSMRIIQTKHRPRRSRSTACSALIEFCKSRGMVAVISAAIVTSIFVVLFSPLLGNDSPILSLYNLKRAVNIGQEGDAGAANGEKGNTSTSSHGHHGQPLPVPTAYELPRGQPTPTELPPGQPTPTEPLSAQPTPTDTAPGQPTSTPLTLKPTPGQSPSDPSEVQTERTVELSTQAGHESIDIDWWQTTTSKETDDLHMDQDGIYATLGAQLSIMDDPDEPTFNRCTQITTWTTRVNFTALHQGSQLCARSHTGKYATLKVAALPIPKSHSNKFVFNGKAWKSPAQQPSPGQPTPGQTPLPQPTPSDQSNPTVTPSSP